MNGTIPNDVSSVYIQTFKIQDICICKKKKTTTCGESMNTRTHAQRRYRMEHLPEDTGRIAFNTLSRP
jgi:hypothetical protein